LAVHGITVDPAKICWEIIYERKGILSKEQRAYWEVNLLRNEVLNGGWHQYFVNSSGDGWKHCLDAVRSMGLETVERDLNAAIKLFSAQGPDVNRDKRWSQLSKFSKHKDNILEELGIDDHAVEVALAKFAVSHREDFLPLMPLK
jgi:hypothetical protein